MAATDDASATTTARSATQPPAEVAAALPMARLRGSGTMRFFGLAVYDARLWVGPGFVPARYGEHAMALELQYARQFSGAAIAQRSIDEMHRVGDFSDAQAASWRTAMVAAFPDVAPGDRLTGVQSADGSTRFYCNGRLTSTIVDAAFARLFFGIWLSPKTSEPALRQALIGPGA